MARKVNTNLVALGSAAILSIYAVGYVWTQPSANSAAALSAAATATPAAASPLPIATAAGGNTATATTPASTATAIARAIASATASAAPATAAVPAATAAAQGYRDGVYDGTGSSRRGDISVAVTIESGQITNVKITRSTTYYPISDVARLPGQVVSRQSANVDFVSGATESSRAFRGAVTQALSQARAPGAAVPAAAPAPGA